MSPSECHPIPSATASQGEHVADQAGARLKPHDLDLGIDTLVRRTPLLRIIDGPQLSSASGTEL
jgi:hypothetical protein